MTPGFSGATSKARPDWFVVSRSPLENATVTPGVRRPFTSRTANVARSPETIRRGNSKIRAPAGLGACCACALQANSNAQRPDKITARGCEGIQELSFIGGKAKRARVNSASFTRKRISQGERAVTCYQTVANQ